jgi:replicative DNA helicase
MFEPVRTPPHNFDAEQALLRSILLSNRAFEKVSEFLQPEHFADPVHGRIFAACGKLIERGQVASPVTLKAHFESDGGLIEIGGTAYLAQLVNSVVSVINAGDYGRLVYDLHVRRELIVAATELTDAAYAMDIDREAGSLIEETERRLFDLAEHGTGRQSMRAFDRVVDSAWARAEQARAHGSGILGLSTGFADLDKVLGGLSPSDLLVLGARPGMGKTAIALAIAHHLAKDGIPVGIFSLEMSAEQLATRLMASESGVSQHAISRGRATDSDWEQARDALAQVRRLPLHIDDTAGASMTRILARARHMKRRHGVGLLIVDHLHLIRAKAENRTQELTHISGTLKQVAKELELPVLALCQLSRAVENRDDKRPTMADLRESGSIEQEADSVMFLYRRAYYIEREEPQKKPSESNETYAGKLADWHDLVASVKNEAELIVAKNRHGPTDKINLFFEPEFARFRMRSYREEVA